MYQFQKHDTQIQKFLQSIASYYTDKDIMQEHGQ